MQTMIKSVREKETLTNRELETRALGIFLNIFTKLIIAYFYFTCCSHFIDENRTAMHTIRLDGNPILKETPTLNGENCFKVIAMCFISNKRE